METWSGPATCAMSRWPSSTRWSTVRSMPVASSPATDGHVEVLGLPVDHDHRHAAGGRLVQERVVEQGGGDDEAVDLAGLHRREVGGRARGVVVGVGGEDGVAAVGQRVLDAADDRREQRVGQVGDQHAHRLRPAGLQAAGDRVDLVAQGRGDLAHARDRGRPDEAAGGLVQRAGGRGGVHPRGGRDVTERRARGHGGKGSGGRRPVAGRGAGGHQRPLRVRR